MWYLSHDHKVIDRDLRGKCRHWGDQRHFAKDRPRPWAWVGDSGSRASNKADPTTAAAVGAALPASQLVSRVSPCSAGLDSLMELLLTGQVVLLVVSLLHLFPDRSLVLANLVLSLIFWMGWLLTLLVMLLLLMPLLPCPYQLTPVVTSWWTH